MCFPKSPSMPTPTPTPPAAQAPIAPESADKDAGDPRLAARARSRLRIDLAAPSGGSGLRIPG